MSVVLSEYLRLEQQMLRVDAVADGEAEADETRDLMDLIWRKLTAAERVLLNARPIVLPIARPSISVRVDQGFFLKPVTTPPRESTPAMKLQLALADLRCMA